MDAVSLLELRTRAQKLSGTIGDPNTTDAQWNALANRHAKKVYGLLVDAGPADYYAAETTITTNDGVAQNPLTVDFRNLIGVYVVEASGRRRPIDPMREGARGNYKPPTGEWSVVIEFIPTMTPLVNDGDTFDAVSGWDELNVNYMARDVLIGRDAVTAEMRANIAEEEARIKRESRKRDRRPKRIVDLDDRVSDVWPYVDTSGSRIACYRLRASNLELYEPLWGYP